MSTTTFTPRGLKINNPNRHIERIINDSEDFSLFNQREIPERKRIELESSYVVTTLPENKAQRIENIIYLKTPLMKQRNNILDNPFKYYNPYYRSKLKAIDAKIDALDLQLYRIESTYKEDEKNIDIALESAQLKLNQICKNIKPK